MATKRRLNSKQVGLKYGFRSGLEEKVAKQLKEADVAYKYEEFIIKYIVPSREAKYTPDFVLLDNGIIVETKGRFMVADRQKHLMIKEQRPDLDIRFVFSNSKARISKTSQTTYAEWCDKHGFKYADKYIPEEWFDESPRNRK